ncbi:DUF7343 domain-containing protein [Archaeoglobus profundus]|uniref:Uncharacterized membrane-associated protein/domain-like protein n=1 Tax=Archaeoglobus profundus (strain DSM 5631 / JCM 9629 / NBRC 100127 / Av18) TaxID=572546 RepID=D2RI22_ARCPA|nr:winged helix-turn-helix transcriptional regulator [Archaeoglobus profundus]ADB57947.1 Uncharacterized membrane-associated protein/domain-like protein [Archaeoglobus profundus DSM 5631]
MKCFRVIMTAFLLTVLIVPVNSAIIKGEVYSWELKEIKAVVEINTTPVQRIVAENGTYEFVVPEGVYEIKAYSVDRELSCNETIVVKGNGTYRLDLILFPNLEYQINFTEPEFNLDTGNNGINYIFPVLGALILVLALVMWRIRGRKSLEKVSKESELPEDLMQVLELLKSLGGRATQKELREKLGWSEAKLSLALTDLERRGYIEKYKKGRGNVIFLK